MIFYLCIFKWLKYVLYYFSSKIRRTDYKYYKFWWYQVKIVKLNIYPHHGHNTNGFGCGRGGGCGAWKLCLIIIWLLFPLHLQSTQVAGYLFQPQLTFLPKKSGPGTNWHLSFPLHISATLRISSSVGILPSQSNTA